MNNQNKHSLCFVLCRFYFRPGGGDTKLGNNEMKVETMCTDPRPEIYTREYVPVCGV